MSKKKIAVLGGGASGLMAAITAAQAGAQVTVIEHKERVGRKILMTGNGKCNLTNLHMDNSFYYSHDLEKAMQILKRFTPEDTISFFKRIGLMTKEKRDGGIYPVAEQAAVVLDILRSTCEQLQVKTILQCEIERIQPGKVIHLSGVLSIPLETDTKSGKRDKGKQSKICKKEKYEDSFDALILACGGCAAMVSGSDGSGYHFARKLGCKVYEPVPALVQLYGKGDFYKSIAGVRTESAIKLLIDNQVVSEEYGELQITDYGISGIPVFQFSRIVSVELSRKKQCCVEIDFYPYDHDALAWDLHGNVSAEAFLEGYLNKKLAALILKRAGIRLDQKVSEISPKSRDAVFSQIHHFMIPVEKTNGFDNAQVCAGGVSLKDVDDNLQMNNHPNIFITGELLDVDGKCGGYNLQWAWTTGYLAGCAAAKL